MIPAVAEVSELGLALYVVAAIGNALLAAILLALHRIYRRPFLLHWGVSWLALALFHLGSMGVFQLGHRGSETVLRLGLAWLTLSLGVLQVAALLSGTGLLVAGRGLRRAWLPALSLLLGAVLVSLTAEVEGLRRLMLRAAILDLGIALAFLGAATGVARFARREASFARWLVVGLLSLVALVRLWDFRWQVLRLEGGFVGGLAGLTVPPLVDLFLQGLLALGLLAWFFEEERAAQARTAQALAVSEQQRARAEHMEAVGRLAGGVAHDFNNLLTAILGHTEILLARTPSGHADREDLRSVSHAATRAAELVHGLLAFSRRQPLRPQRFSLDQLLRDQQRMLARMVGESVQLEFDLQASEAVLNVDPAQLELALMNLVANAREAMPAGGELRLSTALVEAGSGGEPGLPATRALLLEVRDGGCGIPPEALARIFEPFFTTKPGTGTGLGLASVYGFVKQSGGEIRVASEVGLGTTFRLWLPVAAEPLERPEELVPASPARGGNETILLVEDEPQVRLLAQRLLARAGYRVVTAENAEQARAELRAGPERFQLVLSDVVMPGRPVRELLEELLSTQPSPRVLLMSGYSELAIGQHGIELARADFLAKPFTVRSLLEAVRVALDRPLPPRVPSASTG